MESVKHTLRRGGSCQACIEKPSAHCEAGKVERESEKSNRPTSNSAHPANLQVTFHKQQHTKRHQLFSDSLGDYGPIPAAGRKGALAGAYLAVSGADRKPHVGGDHHRER